MAIGGKEEPIRVLLALAGYYQASKLKRLGAFQGISALGLPLRVVAVLGLAENAVDGRAYRPGDILHSKAGRTIEITNTDAEGRIVLADALALAQDYAPDYMVDLATLTGACLIALGDICTGAFGNNQELIDLIIAAGNEAGELIWQMPMFDEYGEQNKSDVADVKNVGGRLAGAITAAKFLAEFVDDTPWVHLDIAGTSLTDKERGYQIKGATGVPARTLVNLVVSLAQKPSK